MPKQRLQCITRRNKKTGGTYSTCKKTKKQLRNKKKDYIPKSDRQYVNVGKNTGDEVNRYNMDLYGNKGDKPAVKMRLKKKKRGRPRKDKKKMTAIEYKKKLKKTIKQMTPEEKKMYGRLRTRDSRNKKK